MSHLGNTVEAPSGFEAEFQSVVSELFLQCLELLTQRKVASHQNLLEGID